jgi:predicted ATPase/DNA-binding CsgD family transcriptional regulator
MGPNDNLPLALDSFLGREAEASLVRRALAEDRLVTLTGPAGAGKSRLALEVARGLRELFPDGVWLVALEVLEDPRRVAQPVATAVGIREELGRPLLDTLAAALATRRILLVLDNCEHLREACAALVRSILERGPSPRVLATSREPLRVPGERVLRLPPLPIPSPGTPAEELVRSPSVALFLDRARRRSPWFEARSEGLETGPAEPAWPGFGPEEVETVAAICRVLEGLPLAIELAAAQTATLPLGALLEHLEAGLDVLRGAPGAARHASLRASLEASYARLGPTERRVFLRLASFAGTFSLEAARAVCGSRGVSPRAVVPAVLGLVEASLVVGPLDPREARYRLLAPVQRFTRDRASECGEALPTDRAHLRFLARWAEEVAAGLEGLEQRAWLERLRVEEDNLRAALDRAEGLAGAAGTGLRLAASLGRFWVMAGRWSEGQERIERLLARVRGGRARGPALLWAAALALLRGRFEEASELASQCLVACRHRPQLAEEARAVRAVALANLGRPQAEQEAARAVEALRALGRARALGEEAARRGTGALGRALMGAGVVARLGGNSRGAVELLREGAAALRSAGDLYFLAHTLSNLGLALAELGAHAQAEALLQEALALRRRLGDRQGVGWSLKDLGDVAVARGQLHAARARYLESLAALGAVGDRETQAAVAESLERIEEARRGGRRPQPRHRAEGPAAGLTPREWEVVELLARGATNREIGEALFITEGTAALHVQHILAKLGFGSRAQVAAWAVLHGLARPPSDEIPPLGSGPGAAGARP